jgi:hypothetical protein
LSISAQNFKEKVMFENLKYANANNSIISATRNGAQLSIPVAPGNADYDEIVEQGLAIAAYTPPAITWADVRSKRDGLLAATDWWAVSDRAMSAEETAYRQALRDVPQNFASPADVVWPTKPA